MANPDKPRDRPTVPQVLPLVNAVYQRHAAGCCMHIITDDCNVEQHWADTCLQSALERGHEDCIAALVLLAQMTDTQRREVYKRHG